MWGRSNIWIFEIQDAWRVKRGIGPEHAAEVLIKCTWSLCTRGNFSFGNHFTARGGIAAKIHNALAKQIYSHVTRMNT